MSDAEFIGGRMKTHCTSRTGEGEQNRKNNSNKFGQTSCYSKNLVTKPGFLLPCAFFLLICSCSLQVSTVLLLTVRYILVHQGNAKCGHTRRTSILGCSQNEIYTAPQMYISKFLRFFFFASGIIQCEYFSGVESNK